MPRYSRTERPAPVRRLAVTALLALSVTAVAARSTSALTRHEGIQLEERSLPTIVLERTQLPPVATWRRMSTVVSREINGLLFAPPDEPGWAFYGRSRDREHWVTVMQSGDGVTIASTESEVRVLDPASIPALSGMRPRWQLFRTGLAIDIGGIRLFDCGDVDDWEFYWLGCESPPRPARLYRADLEDGFMRTTFGRGDRWTVSRQAWALKQYGGGMPTTEAEAQSANYRRAANAFTLVGRDGEAAYGRKDWCNTGVELGYFFGRPNTYAKQDTLERTSLGGEPTYRDKSAIYRSNQIQEFPDTDFFLVQGAPGQHRIAFGWDAGEHALQLRFQAPDEADWRVLRQWERRPFFTNWVRLGLGVIRGCRVAPFVDGDQLGSYPIEAVITGPVCLLAGSGDGAEIDNVVVWSYPKPPRFGTPVFATSTLFAQKELLAVKDVQTGQWTRSQLTFEEDEARLRGRSMNLIRCQFPLYGDFTYQGGPDLPPGDYCMALVDENERPYYTGFFTKTKKGWEMPKGGTSFELEIGRRKGHIVRHVEGDLHLLTSRRVRSTMNLVLGAEGGRGLTPSQHQIYSRCLTHDFFEKAPADWAWREGNFRMDVRWQCQRGWNFMMGKSRDVAVMYSKTAYNGDQEIEFHTAMRFVTPPPYYVLRDMGVSFCTDGRSPASGYTLIYGDSDNTRTVLLRKGKVVAEAPTVIKNLPGGNIHNYWWHGNITRHGRNITVSIDGDIVLEYSDRDPLDGGHVAFWTFRNAISLAKVSINAEDSEDRPGRFLAVSEPLPDSPWRPLNRDQVRMARAAGGGWTVENQVGGGTFAVRCRIPGRGIDLERTPWVSIPLRMDRDCRVGAHLQVSGQSFYYPLTSSTEGLRYLLTPEYEDRDPTAIYRQAPHNEEQVREMLANGRHSSTELTLDLRAVAAKVKNPRLTSITIGNSSNSEYMMLGADGNSPGTSYRIGLPEPRR